MNMPSRLPSMSVVLLSGGKGQRMNSPIPKQYLPFDQSTVLESLVSRLGALMGNVPVHIVADKEDLPVSLAHLHLASSGKNRAESLKNGLNMLEQQYEDARWILVHDAARPCVSLDLMQRFVHALATVSNEGVLSQGLIAAVQIKDTLKQFENHALCPKVVNRDEFLYAQTPQAFRLGDLKKACNHAVTHGLMHTITDEASLMHAWQEDYDVRWLEGEQSNIKITTKSDVALAEAIYQAQARLIERRVP